MKKKTIILIAIIVISILSIFIWSIAAPNKLVYFGGSSSVNPFMQIATKEFSEDGDKKYEIIYNSNGSQNGVKSVENGTYSAGMISKEVKEDTLNGSDFSDLEVESELTSENFGNFKEAAWEGEGINAVEFAIDAIVIMYNPPKWVDDELLNLINFDFKNHEKDHKEIIKEVFSNPKYKWIDFLTAFDPDLNVKHGDETMTSVSRESGSGTRSAFDDFFGIEDVVSGTANSNGSMITQLRDTQGSIGYVSYGFYKKNANNNLKTPWFNSERLGNKDVTEKLNEDGTIKPTKLNNEDYIKLESGYQLKRPFIMLFDSKNKKKNQVLDFIEFLIGGPKEEPIDAYAEEGLVKNIKYYSKKTIIENSKTDKG